MSNSDSRAGDGRSIEELIDASSLGTPGAKALRSRTPREVVDRIMERVAEQPFAMPDRIAIDAKGYGWRTWDDEDHWSMIPTNPDNSPIPQPVTWFVRPDEAVIQRAIEEWATIQGGPKPDDGVTLAHYIATKLRGPS